MSEEKSSKDLREDVINQAISSIEKKYGKGAIMYLSLIHILYFSPEGLDDEFIKTMRDSSHLVKYLDIPLQHVDSTILQKMRRPSSIEKIREKLEKLRECVPGIFLRTTFLVGFPGEDVYKRQG